MMSGFVHVRGDASQAEGAAAHGSMLVVDGNASERGGISLKGADVLMRGSVAHMSALCRGRERSPCSAMRAKAWVIPSMLAHLYVSGSVASPGADCTEKPLRDLHRAQFFAEPKRASMAREVDVSEYRRQGTVHKLYNFHVDNVGPY